MNTTNIIRASLFILLCASAYKADAQKPTDDELFKELTKPIVIPEHRDPEEFWLSCQGDISSDNWKTKSGSELVLKASPTFKRTVVEKSNFFDPGFTTSLEARESAYVITRATLQETLKLIIDRAGSTPGKMIGTIYNEAAAKNRMWFRFQCSRTESSPLPKPKL